jgi:hypothetical protein
MYEYCKKTFVDMWWRKYLKLASCSLPHSRNSRRERIGSLLSKKLIQKKKKTAAP